MQIAELEDQKKTLAIDLTAMEEEVELQRKHASERFEIARKKAELESLLSSSHEKIRALEQKLSTENDLSERL